MSSKTETGLGTSSEASPRSPARLNSPAGVVAVDGDYEHSVPHTREDRHRYFAPNVVAADESGKMFEGSGGSKNPEREFAIVR